MTEIVERAAVPGRLTWQLGRVVGDELELRGPIGGYFVWEDSLAGPLAWGKCGYCGARGQVAELRVYARAPGSVVQCPECGNVLMVLVAIGDSLRVHLTHYELVDSV